MKKGNRKLNWIVVAVVVIAIVAIAYKIHANKTIQKENPDSGAEQDQQIIQSQEQYQNDLAKKGQVPAINGVMIPSAQLIRPFAVIIENFYPDARPESGLSQADIVYEALAEGGITRYMVVFQTQNVKSIGPVRSARTYFNDWAQELRAIFVHVGGNSDALYYLKKGIPGVSDADQFFNGSFFTRIASRIAPHNTYTSTDKLEALAQKHNFSTEATYPNYQFKDDAPDKSAPASKISIDFSTPEYAVKWVYDSSTNAYKRYLAGSAQVDAGNGKNIFAKDVIVQRVANWPVATDTPLSISMGTRTGGDASIFMDGKEISGTWKLVNGRTMFFDQNGNQIAFNRGQIWIEVVPPANSVTVSK